MPQGLQVGDAAGNLVVDTNDRLGRVLGILTINTASGSHMNAGLEDGTPFAMQASDIGIDGWEDWAPEITFSGNTLSWDFGTFDVTPTLVIYGIY